MNLPSGPQGKQPDSKKTRPTADLFSATPPSVVETFGTIVVLPYNISPTAYSVPDPNTGRQKAGGQGRAEAEGEIKEGFRRLIAELQNANLNVTTRTNGDGDKVWVFVGAGDRRLAELAARERSVCSFYCRRAGRTLKLVSLALYLVVLDPVFFIRPFTQQSFVSILTRSASTLPNQSSTIAHRPYRSCHG